MTSHTMTRVAAGAGGRKTRLPARPLTKQPPLSSADLRKPIQLSLPSIHLTESSGIQVTQLFIATTGQGRTSVPFRFLWNQGEARTHGLLQSCQQPYGYCPRAVPHCRLYQNQIKSLTLFPAGPSKNKCL